jgi:Zn-dependent peptidase ImmA (M78 family)/transcriptional regulator with XRE-family HTH domain
MQRKDARAREVTTTLINQTFNPDMILLAREARGHSQTMLAKLIGITQGALSRIESGSLSPSHDVMARIADKLAFPLSLFAVPLRPHPLPLPFYRKKVRLGANGVRRIQATVNLARLRLEILHRASEPRTPRLVLGDVQGRHDTPEQIAALLRVHWRIARGPILNLVEAIEAAGVLVASLDFGTRLIDGLSMWEPSDSLPPIIFVHSQMTGDRLRWTLAHELGHIVLHHHLQSVTTEDIEAEANAFASELLMPEQDVRGHLANVTMQSLAQLKLHWRVSMRALLIRAQHLRRIQEGAARKLWMQLSSYGGTSEPVEIEREQPKAIRTLVERHLSELGYSQKQLSATLYLTLEEFRAEYLVGANNSPLRLA